MTDLFGDEIKEGFRPETKAEFEKARVMYQGKKRGLDSEFANFIFRAKKPLRGQPRYNPDDIVYKLIPAIEMEIKNRKVAKRDEKFHAEWKHMQTWINQCEWSADTGSSLSKIELDNKVIHKKKMREAIIGHECFKDWSIERVYDYCRTGSHYVKMAAKYYRPEIVKYAEGLKK